MHRSRTGVGLISENLAGDNQVLAFCRDGGVDSPYCSHRGLDWDKKA